MEENGNEEEFKNGSDEPIHDVIPVSGLYENWFLDYASYVILERAVPDINDGLKPVQRRILHAMKEMDDGRFNKVANIIGSTMQYHPHGDMSIGDAMVALGQKDLLIDMQGNWGDVRTGDRAAASRYIEARPSKLALDILYNPQTTNWQLSYDGRKKEPITLPVKFPLLLAQGVEGIAVGLSTKILPHNFCELIDASVKYLRGKSFKLFPDFQTGGVIDVEEYNKGARGGKVKVRACIEEYDKKNLVIKDIPFGTTTTSVIESIIKANDKGKIKIKKVTDNTAKDIEILVELANGVSPDITMDALYAFTDCQVSISPNACVIVDEKPVFMDVHQILTHSTDKTVSLLTQELEIKKGELQEKILFSSLEKIFIENRIYRDIEECETWESVLETIDQGLEPFKEQFYREIVQDDIIRLTEIKIKRISKFDAFKADEMMKKLEEDLAQVEHHLANIIDYAVAYYENLLSKYGKGRERKTEISSIETITATTVAANNAKLYANFKEGFVGYGMKKDEYICDCSDLDDIIVFHKNGTFSVVKIQDKVFVGKDIIHAAVFNKNDERMVYNMSYVDGKSGKTYIKRFNVTSVTRERIYNLTKSDKGSKVHYFSANPNGEAELITVYLTAGSTARKKVFDFDFADIEIKGRGAGGNILTKYPVRKIVLKSEGKSTLAGTDIWYDETIGRLNRDERGVLLGNFNADDKIVVFYKDGTCELTSFELSNHYNQNQIYKIEKFDSEGVITAIHQDGESKVAYIKRFAIEATSTDKVYPLINESKGSKLIFLTSTASPKVEVGYKKKGERNKSVKEMELADIIDKKGWKAIGNKFPLQNILSVKELESNPEPDPNAKKDDSLDSLKDSIRQEVEKEESQNDESYDVGSSVEFDTKKKDDDDEKDQLGLFG
ncbi:DNA gyrase/topoisomerase IV subunit A [Reichenbachiella ulvae]|uniref:DNA gyrase/topoisomerase IV subunit A n=1 Tax=Reichenbachiella ulvae TaxID=2980104 RepID=A0ABT3CQW7_9BACT|nr:DNA gyrase/topoisomerase IV subunit A [Reichenbachiella ulvae]MCV9386111.1 DNA gyrase/topoisomerase IV subunit A [Reichenbachiella ulvae]